MSLNRAARKALLTVHVLSSIAWFGAAAAFLAIAVTCALDADPAVIRAGYLLMPRMVDAVLIPLALAAFITGIVESLTTEWGLLRHYWVIAKLTLTVAATIVLVTWTRTADAVAAAARSTSLDVDQLRTLAASPVLHSAAALVVLAGITILGIYKPKGLTRYGWTKLHSPRPPAAP